METPEVSDAETKHYAEIGLTEEGVCQKAYVPDKLKADGESRRFDAVISTGAVDRDRDTVKVDGWDTSNFMKNPVVMFGHRHDIPPVAKALSVVKRAGALHATFEFPPAGVYDLADTCYGLAKAGCLGALSVGFRAKDGKYSWNEQRGGVDFEEQELLEFSLVNVPSNPQAILRAAKDFAAARTAGVDLQPLRKAMDLAEPPVVRGTSTEETPAKFVLTLDGKVLGQAVEKAGRRLSSKTESSLRSAHKSATEAVEHLTSVLGDCEDEMDDKSTPTEPKPVLFVTPSPAPSAPVFLVSLKAVQAAIAAAVTETVRSEVNRLRGRLD